MTDAEIMKGVKLCNGDLGNCKECPFDSIGKNCGIELAKAEIGLIERLQAENAAFRNEADENAALSMENKMRADRLEAENAALRERLEKAVELPYKRKRLLWGDKDKETLLCPDCLTDLMGGIGDETFVVQCPNCGCFVDCMVEPIPFTEATEARLKELQGEKECQDV